MKTSYIHLFKKIAGLLFIFTVFTQCQPESLQFDNMWVREPLKNMGMTAGYVQIENSSPNDIVLQSASSPAFEKIELHETIIENDVMQMRQLQKIVIPAGQKLELKPHHNHLMLIGPKQAIQNGDTIQITLFFESIPAKQLEFSVKKSN